MAHVARWWRRLRFVMIGVDASDANVVSCHVTDRLDDGDEMREDGGYLELLLPAAIHAVDSVHPLVRRAFYSFSVASHATFPNLERRC